MAILLLRTYARATALTIVTFSSTDRAALEGGMCRASMLHDVERCPQSGPWLLAIIEVNR